MSGIIDILCAIDATDIIARYPNPSTDPDSPTAVSNTLIYMIVKQGSAISGNGQGELNVQAQVGDVIRWRETSLSSNFEYAVMFYNFSTSSTDLITLPPQLIGGVTQSGTVIQVPEPLPRQSTSAPPWLPSVEENVPYHYWQSTVQSAGSVTYHWQFQIADRNGNVNGYFQWDPFITISN